MSVNRCERFAKSEELELEENYKIIILWASQYFSVRSVKNIGNLPATIACGWDKKNVIKKAPEKFLGLFSWCRGTESNLRHGDFQSITLSFLTSLNSLTYWNNWIRTFHILADFPHFSRFWTIFPTQSPHKMLGFGYRLLEIGPVKA